MYVTSSIENNGFDLAQTLFKMFVIAKRKFLRKKILGKFTRKAGNWDVKFFVNIIYYIKINAYV